MDRTLAIKIVMLLYCDDFGLCQFATLLKFRMVVSVYKLMRYPRKGHSYASTS